MEVLSDETFIWNMQVDTLSVQHDPANNNQTRYQRLVRAAWRDSARVRADSRLQCDDCERRISGRQRHTRVDSERPNG